MPDMTCPACGEPSDVHHVRHDMSAPLPTSVWVDREARFVPIAALSEASGLLPYDMPNDLRALTLAAIEAEATLENILRSPVRPIPDEVWDPAEAAQQATAEAWRAAMYKTGLRHGCDCCLLDPERRQHRESDLEKALFDSAWDGDPAEIFGA